MIEADRIKVNFPEVFDQIKSITNELKIKFEKIKYNVTVCKIM
jgi:hypothetical protein